MEANGLQGSVQIESLFDEKPGSDKKKKSKLKKKLRQSGNENSNSTQTMDKRGQQTLQVGSPSEETLYLNAVQKRTSSSSENNGLDLFDESNMLNNLILEARAESGNESCNKEQRHQPQPSTSNQP